MKCTILHESAGRMRVHVAAGRLTLEKADLLEYGLRTTDGVTSVTVFDRTSDVIIKYKGTSRESILNTLATFSFDRAKAMEVVPEHTGRELSRKYENELVNTVAIHYAKRLLLPMPARAAFAAVNSVKYILKGLKALSKFDLNVSVLDATAITISMLQNDFNTAASVMFLLQIGEILEEWTHKKSVDDLATTMSLGVDKVWYRSSSGEDMLIPVNQLKKGDLFVVRTGNMIPCDGKVVSGESSINQASITGESMPVVKTVGGYVYAGTIVEEGECIIAVDKVSGSARYDRIVKMIEESEKLKSAAESSAANLADKLVPYSFLGTGLTWLITRNVTKAISCLMVDFSCALKLAMPIAVLSAMKECSTNNITVKGGKYLEAIAQADTIVFDKTGTLTNSQPRVVSVTSFSGHDENEMLRIAACLEEHYPHSMANAIVSAASERDLRHDECHSDVSYTVAHGISGTVNGEKVVVGSYHFVFEDEKCVVPEDEQDKFNNVPGEYSQLYMAFNGVLSAVICIDDPIKNAAYTAIKELKKLGLRIVMMTGDSYKTAAAVARKLGLDEFRAEVLPEDKAAFVNSEHEAGRKVIMIGDGINDSPALSAADAGIAIASGAAIAKEIADVTISSDDLYALVRLRKLSSALQDRIGFNYRFIMSFNSALILLGVMGILQPASTALIHNISTIGISLNSMTELS
ncbi:MAG: heavy metal translocating P-type ATPase [Eubacteriales bacterium]|nr:heavy metal translocating P-type ATPase [Eubacteriales bacterium]